MVYNDITTNDALRYGGQLLLNVTWWVDSQVADRFGTPAGRVVVATATVYAVPMAVVLGIISACLLLRSSWRYAPGVL